MVDKISVAYTPSKAYSIDSKVTKSSKYAHVGPMIDTGRNQNQVKILSRKTLRNYITNKGELFKRIKPSTVAHLLRRENNSVSTNRIGDSDTASVIRSPKDRELTARTLMHQFDNSDCISQSKASESSKISMLSYASSQLGLNENTEFVVVDLREREDFELYHVNGAIHFPGPGISRDKYPPAVFNLVREIKNKENRLIIVYHQDERQGVPYAATFVERGFENVFLISGGIEGVLQEFPDLIVGKKVPPISKKSSNPNFLYKRSRFNEYPEEADVIIASNDLLGENYSSVTSSPHKSSTVKAQPNVRSFFNK